MISPPLKFEITRYFTPFTWRRETLIVVLAMLAGALLWGVNFEPLWIDEAFSAYAVTLPYMEIWQPYFDPPHPPIYYLALKAWSTFGDGDAWLRLLSVAFGAAAVPFVYAIGRTLGGARVGILSMLIFLTVPAVYALVTDMRSYAMLLFLGAVCTWCALQVATRDDLLLWKWAALWLGVVVSGGLVLGTNHLAGLWVPFVAVGCIPACIADRRRLLAAAGIGLVGAAVYAVVFLPHLFAGVIGSAPWMGEWEQKAIPPLLGIELLTNGRELPLAALGMMAGIWSAWRAWCRSWRLTAFAGCAVFIPVLAYVVAAAIRPDLIVHPKGLLVIYPMFAAIVAYGIARMRRRWGAAVLTFLLAANAAGIVLFLAGDRAPPWHRAGEIIEASARGSAAVVVCEPDRYGEVRYDRVARFLRPEAGDVHVRWYGEDGARRPAPLPAGYDEVWTVKAGVSPVQGGAPSWIRGAPPCETPASWGQSVETRELRYDRLSLWRILSGREKEHLLTINRYQPNAANGR